MYNYLVFGGVCFYATGGANDLLYTAPTAREATARAKSIIGQEGKPMGYTLTPHQIEWSHVLEVATGKIIARYGGKPYGEFDNDKCDGHHMIKIKSAKETQQKRKHMQNLIGQVYNITAQP